MRVGIALFYDPESIHSSPVMVARLRYLEVVNRYQPGLFEKIEKLSFPSRNVGTYPGSPVMVPDFSQLDKLFASLNLPDDCESNYWFREPAWAYWNGVRLAEDGTRAVGLSGDVTTGPEVDFKLTLEEQGALQRALDIYKPAKSDNRADAMKEAMKVARENLKRHFNEVDAAHSEAGFKKTPNKRSKGDLLVHFEWLYLTHIGEQGKPLTQREVADRFRVNDNKVSKEVGRLKKLIFGLESKLQS